MLTKKANQQVWNLIAWTAGLGVAGLAMCACALLLLHNPSEVRAFRKPWHELSMQERRAAEFLGFSEHTWQRVNVAAERKPWSHLNAQERQAAQVLGFTPVTWRSQSHLSDFGGPTRSSTAELEDMFVAAQKEIVDKLSD